MTIGDKNFFHVIRRSVAQVAKFYPGSAFYIYDWGFTYDQAKTLRDCRNTHVVDWKANIDLESGFKTVKFGRNLKYYIKKYLLGYPAGNLERARQTEYLLSQKPHCMLDCSKKINGNMVFLDGDTLLVNRIDEAMTDDYDIGVTLRPREESEKNRKMGEYQLNSGVIFFNTGSSVMQAFIGEWIRRMKTTKHHMIEQTALNRLVKESSKDIYDGYYKIGVLRINGRNIRCKVFPCTKYNYNWIEKGFDKDKNRILHFKGRRHSKEMFESLLEKNAKNMK